MPAAESIAEKVTDRTRAIMAVRYGGIPASLAGIREVAGACGIPVIEDAIHALGARYDGKPIGAMSEFTMYSFQAIKHLTTGDGGLLTFLDESLAPAARRLSWFGIDRSDKQKGIWENDITEIGYKYQMTDIGAAIGLAGLEEFDETSRYRKALYQRYVSNLKSVPDVRIVDDFDPRKEHAAWLFTILVERRVECQLKLRSRRIESGQTHYRNDRYTVFGCNEEFPAMDSIDDQYLILPLHTRMNLDDVDHICEVLKEGW